METEAIISEIQDVINDKVKPLSDIDYLTVLKETIGNLQSEVEAKQDELDREEIN